MGKTESRLEVAFQVSDVSGQKLYSVRNAPADATVGELIHEMIGKMNLPRNDAAGAPLTYQARREREGRHLSDSELIADALEEGDRVTLLPNIDAGLGH
jgi:hypothetical protein